MLPARLQIGFCLPKRHNVSVDMARVNLVNNVPTCSLLNVDFVTESQCNIQEEKARDFFTDSSVLNRLGNCNTYFTKINTVAFKKVRPSEKKTPLAFALVTHGHLGILEAQLATLFRPHNAYCIFIDKKSSASFKSAVGQMLDCYKQQFPESTIFLANPTFPVFWADITLIRADLQCMKMLLDSHQTWKFVINQAGTSLPQVPVQVMAEMLSHFRDNDNAVISGRMPNKLSKRIRFVHIRPFIWEDIERDASAVNTSETLQEDQSHLFMYPERPIETSIHKKAPPYGLNIFKGEREMVLSRPMLKFSLEHKISKALWVWVQDVAFAEEIFFNTLVRINQANPLILKNNTYIGNQDKNLHNDYTQGLCARRTLWYYNKRVCHGQMKRHLCNLDLADLPEVYERVCLFINKFDLSVDARIVYCLYEYLTLSSS